MSLLGTVDNIGQRLSDLLGDMTPRDRALLGVMALALLGVVTWLATGWMSSRTKQLELAIADTAQAQSQVNMLMGRYSELAGEVAGLDSRLAAGKDFQPASWLESLGKEMNIAENIKSINERGNEVTDYYKVQKMDLVVNDITLPQVVDLMHRMESEPRAIRTRELRIKTHTKDRSLFNVRMEFAVLKPLGDG